MNLEISKRDRFIAFLSRRIVRYRASILSGSLGFLLGRTVNELSVEGAGPGDALANLFLLGRRPANWLTWVVVILAIMALSLPYLVRRYYVGRQYANLFAERLIKLKSPLIAPYTGLGVDSILSLQTCPEMHRGWRMSEVRLHHSTTAYSFSEKYRKAYADYFQKNFNEKRFHDDRPKAMLTRNPVAFSDAPTLVLHTMELMYSHVQFTKDIVAPITSERDLAIRALLKGNAIYPNTFCMQPVVVTQDGMVLRTKRSEKVDYYPGSWSVSIEEQIELKDLEAGGVEGAVIEWGKRALLEELGLGTGDYNHDNLRVLSVFLEADTLNISLCCHVVLDMGWRELDTRLKGIPRKDYEFTEWNFLEARELLNEVFYPSEPYHPSSRYRMLLAAIRQIDEPHVATALNRFLPEGR